jgi:hypothetical protein
MEERVKSAISPCKAMILSIFCVYELHFFVNYFTKKKHNYKVKMLEKIDEFIALIIKSNAISIQTYSLIYTELFNYSINLRHKNVNMSVSLMNIVEMFLKPISKHYLLDNNVDNANTLCKLGIRLISIFNFMGKGQNFDTVLESILSTYGYTKKWSLSMMHKVDKYKMLLTFIEPMIGIIIENEEFINMEIVEQFLYHTIENEEHDKIDDWFYVSNIVASYLIKNE